MDASRCYLTDMRALLAALVLVVGCNCSKKAPEPKSEPTPPAAAPTAAAEGAKGAPAGGPRVEGKGFIVEVKPPAEAAAGGEHAAQVVLTPTKGYHLNKEFPTLLKVTPPTGAECPKLEQRVSDAAKFEEQTAQFDVKCTAAGAGELKYEATFKFAVCTETTCDPKTEKLAWNVSVK